MPSFAAGAKLRASALSFGFVTDLTDATSSATTTTTEVVSTSIQWTAVAGVRYKVTYSGNAQSTVAGDQAVVRLRWKNTSTVDTTGTSFAVTPKTCAVANKGDGVLLVGQFSGQTAGNLIVVSTISRNLGSGTVSQGFASIGPGYFLVEIV
jgi:hypothetical protein